MRLKITYINPERSGEMFFKRNSEKKPLNEVQNQTDRISLVLPAFAKAVYHSSLTSGAGFEIKVEVESYYEHLKEIFHRTDQISNLLGDIQSHVDEVHNFQKTLREMVYKADASIGETVGIINMSENAMTELVKSMDNLKENINGIRDILGMISDISNQTNLLALNAAIEAARAGEHGKGFAVVADEVRNLATKASQNIENIGSVIEKIISDTNRNVNEVSTVRKTITKITKNSEEISKIFSSVKEKSDSISQKIDKAYEEILGVSENLKVIIQDIKGIESLLKNIVILAENVSQKTSNNLEEYISIWNNLTLDKKSFDIELLKRVVDHAVWMEKVSQSLEGKIDWIPTDHTQCNLGKWYYSEGKKEIEKYGSEAINVFISIEQPHSNLHSIGISAIKKAREGNFKEAVELAKKMYAESKDIIDKILKLHSVIIKYQQLKKVEQ